MGTVTITVLAKDTQIEKEVELCLFTKNIIVHRKSERLQKQLVETNR